MHNILCEHAGVLRNERKLQIGKNCVYVSNFVSLELSIGELAGKWKSLGDE